jgi:molybdopterin molybdotransferase
VQDGAPDIPVPRQGQDAFGTSNRPRGLLSYLGPPLVMITVEEARSLLMKELVLLPEEERPLSKAFGCFTAHAITAPFDHPRFDQSAVDGYCFGWQPGVDQWHVVGTAAAGDAPSVTLAPGQCLRILTGAELPAGADTVVMQEHVDRRGDLLSHGDARLRSGANVRRRGEQLRVGDLVLEAGMRLNAPAAGLLLSAGIDRVVVRRQPRIGVVVTGNEFCPPGDPSPGRIFSSNGEMLLAALQAEGLTAELHHAPDDRETLRALLGNALRACDVVVTTGGVSVGDLDLVRPVLEELDTRIVLHGVAQKPGKPMLMGRWQEHLVMGLPGNPRAVLVLFWLYVLPALRAMQGAARPWLPSEELPLAEPARSKGGRSEFRAAQVRNGKACLLRDEGSHMLASLLHADALAEIPGHGQGTTVRVHHLPQR